MELTDILQLLTNYQYLILFPVSIIEGPIITIISGFLVAQGIMNMFVVYGIIVVGDIIGDTIAYGIGRYGVNKLRRLNAFLRITPKKMKDAEKFFDIHQHKAIIFSKVFHGVGTLGLIAAGMLKVQYPRYLSSCFKVSLLQSAFLLILGVFFGHMYTQLSKYLDYFAAIVGVVFIVAVVFYVLYKTKNLAIMGK